jgi:RsiW-degrading membrane proteinase PrsW (M82 family)
LYAFLAAWHFSMPWWVLLTVALWGTILTVMAVGQEFEKKSECDSSTGTTRHDSQRDS